MKNRNFTVSVKGEEVNLTIVSPSMDDNRESNKVYHQAFSDAVKAKSIVRARMDDILKEQGLWDDGKQQQYEQMQANLLDSERKLAKGGISLKEAKKVALEMRKTRENIKDLISVRTNLDNHTAEGQADNAKFNYLVYACTVYADNPSKKFFSSYNDYLTRSTEYTALVAAQHVANFVYGLEDNFEAKLPENKFLKDYKFVDDQLRLVNEEGKLVDEQGRLVDAFGRYVNENGEYIDKDGNRVDEEGEYVVEFSPFLDDKGQPVVLDSDEPEPETTEEPAEEEPKPKKKRTKAKEVVSE